MSDAALPVEAATGRTPPPKVSSKHFKLIPETMDLRARIRDEAFRVAATLDRSRPLTKRELEAEAHALVERMGLDEGFLGFAMVMLGNGFWREQFVSIPFHRRMLLLPHCLKHVEQCSAHYDEFGLHCEDCGACAIGDFKMKAERLGYKVLVAEGTPIVLKIIVSGYIDGILGVACLNVLEKAFEKVVQSGVPAYAIPLHSSNCKSTAVDNDWVLEMLDCYREEPSVQTRTYVPLLRRANAMFEGEAFGALLPRVRSTPEATNGHAASDPIGGTEAIARDWLQKGGKRFRPFITLAAYEALQPAKRSGVGETLPEPELPDALKRVSMAMEAFHKASLSHDDIEDDDAYRYGHLTLHRRYGVSTAINIGDYLVGVGYRLIGHPSSGVERGTAADILARLADAHCRLAEGQGAELLWRDARPADRVLAPIDALKIYALKTAPAFEVSLYAGLRMAGAVDARLDERIAAFARHVGVGFQICNDLKDWQADLGNKRAAGADALQLRPTLLLALALESASAEEREEIVSHAASQAGGREWLQRLAGIYEARGVFQKARRLVEKHRERAEAVADEVQPEPLRALLYFLVDTLLAEETAEAALERSALLPILAH